MNAGSSPDNAQPPSSAIGTNVSESYQGPFPSQVQKELVGPVQLIRSGKVDQRALTVTLPLYQGSTRAGATIWYILTDTTDKPTAEALGLNHSGKLVNAAVRGGFRSGRLRKNGRVVFDAGTVDFAPKHQVVPGAGAKPFPPKVAKPGSVGDKAYSPLVRLKNAGGHIYNAPIVAANVDAARLRRYCKGGVDRSVVHDRVTKSCPDGRGGGTATHRMVPGFSFSRPILYMSTDASKPDVAAIKKATFAPALGNIGVGRDDGGFSAVERLFVTINGPMGNKSPQRQGPYSALTDARGKQVGPLNLFGGVPTIALDYSPLWDLNLGEWTTVAIDKGYRSRVVDELQYLGLVEQGHITGPMGGKYGSSGAIVNCPVVARLP